MQAPSELLQSLEELGSLTKEFGLYSLKPFNDWKSSIWSKKVFKMRLCNAGELLDIFSQCQTVAENAKVQAMKIELLIRAIYSIDDRPLVTKEELEKFNDDNNLELSMFEFLRMWLKNLEQVVIERLDLIYHALQTKQLRQLEGKLMCGHCGQHYSSFPEGAKRTKHMLCEIVDKECLSEIDPELYEFVEESTLKKVDTEEKAEVAFEGSIKAKNLSIASEVLKYKCTQCGESFKDPEALNDHRIVCDKND